MDKLSVISLIGTIYVQVKMKDLRICNTEKGEGRLREQIKGN